MSGPYRFNQESAKSPLDRTTSPFSAGQPVSFKTNVNRSKTKKWVTAKKNAYDGDDWGDYDEYDEYGVDQEPPPPPPAPAQSQRYYAGGAPQRTYTDRSFTEPVHQGPPGQARRNSFDAGEEHRAFSTSMAPPQQYDEPEPQGRRDFTPSAMPPPLQTQVSPMPSDINASPARTQFPPRKSSIGQADSPVVTSPRSRTGSHSDKPLPFVRPADIYRRVEEERERERASLDSSRPSLDSLTGRPKEDLHSPTSDGGRMLQPLETVAERKSEYLPNFDSAFTNDKHPASSSGPSQTAGSHIPAVAPPCDQGFRSVVDQAFTRADDQNSIPPTPISKDSGESDMTRTNTASTYGISPIMSRVPSAATSAMKRNQAAGEGSTPVITEEPSDAAATVPQGTSYFPHDPAHAAASKPVTDHTRNLSSTSLPRTGLATPTRGDSPARSPVLAPQKDLPQPEAAQVAEDSPDRMQTMDGGLSGPSPAYASREADIASAAKTSPQSGAFGAAEKQSQDAFLDSHVAQSPIEDALPRSRSESPSKGRVQALAGKFGDVASSRRGSTQSNMSRNSVQSWEKSHDNSRAPSPTKGSPSKPSSPTKEFRPHLPGQWESYATSAATPMDQGDRNKSLDFANDKASTSLENADLTPTTAKRPVDEVTSDDNNVDPLTALKNAGAAMAQSFKATVGIDDASPEAQSQEQHKKDMSHGNMYMPRPLQLERTASSISSIPPTPPAKDTPADEHPPHLPSKDVDTETPVQQKRPDFFQQLSTQPSVDDEESDRLRKEIVASLTPVASTDPHGASLLPGSPGTNRASSILPAEYDSYWADGGEHATARPSHDADRSIPAIATTAAVIPAASQTSELPKPSLLNRFSWEDNTPQLATSGSAVSSSAVPEPTKSAPQHTAPVPSVDRVVEEERNQWSGGHQDPYFGPAHTLTVTKPDPMTDPDPPARFPTSPVNHGALASPTREHTRSPGLHVVNSAEDPEAVDLPPRLSAEHSAPAIAAQDDTKVLPQEVGQEISNAAITTAASVPEATLSGHVQASNHEPSPASPTSGKPLGAREIATINSTAERIATYNSTRQHWATHDHGLEDWLTSAMSANPELASQTAPVQRPTTGTVRHKHTASLSLLGKFGSASTYQLPGGEHNTPSTQAAAGVESPTAGASPASGAAFDRRVASRQLEAKGKDLLHTANVLSGKGLTSAKGLFAKGKSRFGREKGLHSRTDSMPSSREASEVPELMSSTSRSAIATTTPERTANYDLAETDSPREGRKKRRFSLSSFGRSSRSRSRPTSIALPSNVSFFSSTPKGTPPRELSRILGEEKGRPHSYHAPDSWNIPPAPYSVSANYPQSTPPREQQSRLGILPSPAKSAFSTQDKEDQEDIPPVPQIPEKMQRSNDLSHEVLQSVIRYSTPPIPAASNDRNLAISPVFRDETIDEMSRKPEQKATCVQQRSELLPQHKSPSPVPGGTERNINVDEHAPSHVSAEWPLVDFQPATSVSTNDNAGRGSLQPQSHVPTDINRSLFDEDDQPPRLSYEPIHSSRRSDEVDSLPSYLVPTHLDVSDDEESGAVGGLHKNGINLLLAEPRVENPSVSPLQAPAQSILDESSVPGQAHVPQRNEITSAPTASAPDAAGFPDSVGPHVAPNEYPQPVSSTTNTTFIANSSIPAAAHESIMSPAEGGNTLLDPSKREADKADEDRDLASSPAPVWFANNKLEVSKARTRDAGDAKDDHVSDQDANPNLAVPAGVSWPAHGLAPRSSATALRVVRAEEVEVYAASESSFASWDDSALTNSVSGSSQPGDMRDESDLVTPVAQAPKTMNNQAEGNTGNLTARNGYFTGNGPQTMDRPQQQSNELTVPERSKSMLSMISSMVSENGTPISPTTSNAGRSTPSTIRRMQRESSGKTPVTSERIPEESMVNYDDRTPTAKDDDFDLYADHNGIVKDVQDESGQPLRVDQPRNPEVRIGSQGTEVGLPAPAPVISEPPHEDRPRYSTERPMSFVSGPTDQDGRPQDQLNQAIPPSNGTSRPSAEPQLSRDGLLQYAAAPQLNAGPRSDRALEGRDMRHEYPPAQIHMGASGQTTSNNEAYRAQPRASMQPIGPNVPLNVPSNSFHPSSTNGHAAQINPNAGQPGRDPRMFASNPVHPVPNRLLADGQIMTPDQDPRNQDPANGQYAGPRNQYEYQQHMMRRQTQHPRAQAAAGHGLNGGMQGSKEHTFKQQEKSSSLPKLSSVFKGFGGKGQGNNQSHQAAQPPNAALQPDQRLTPMDHTRMPSSHSAVSSLHRDQGPVSAGDQVSLPAPSTRPPSNGAESHFSHVSQGSTNVQPAGSRVDLRKPASPMPFQGIPPKLVPASAGTGHVKAPEKKKRFSALGNIFARSNDANPSKTKLSKEEKKAQKAQRHSTAPQMQNPGSQWPQPQQQQFRPPPQSMPSDPSQYPPRQSVPQQMRPMGPQYASQQTMSPASLQNNQSIDPYGVPQRYQQAQPGMPPQAYGQGAPHGQNVPPGQASAYQSTRQLAEQHQAAQKALGGAGPGNRVDMDLPRQPHAQQSLPPHQNSYGPPPGGYYNPNSIPSMPEKGAYNATQAARALAEQQHRQMTQGRDVHGTPHDPRQQQHQQHPQPSVHEQEAYRLLQLERLRLEQQRLQLEAEQRSYTVAGAEQPQQGQRNPQNIAYNAPMEGRQHPQQQSMPTTRLEHQQPLQHHQQHDVARDASHDELLRAHQERQRLEQQLRSQQYADRVQSNQRSVSGPLPAQNVQTQVPPAQRHVSSPIAPQPEPQYDTPQIPAAYNHVSGAFISPPDLRPQSQPSSPHHPDMHPQQYKRHYSNAQMPPLSPQVSAQSQMLPGQRTHSDASIVSVVSPLSAQAQDLPSVASPPTQRSQKPRMSSISEVNPGTPERPWHLNFPEGATEQEIVRARQRQFMQQQFSAQQQQHAERAAQSPSPRVSSHSQSPAPPQPIPTSTPSQQGGGFKELLPRSSPQPYTQTSLARTSGSSGQAASAQSAQPALDQNERGPSPASFPLPMSPEPRDVRSPINPLADALSAPPPPPKSPHGHIRPMGPTHPATSSPAQQHAAAARDQYEPTPPQEDRFAVPPPGQTSQFQQNMSDDPPPSYDGPGMPNEGMDKSRPDRIRPANIATDVGADSRGRQGEPRARQPSIGILQHPQPASMAASPQRSSADMGAESLRRQLLQQDEYSRMERIQRAQIQRAESERERLEREAARARARELERSVSGGIRVGSIRSVAGSRNGGQPGWERRGSTSRPVFELPAVEDDEPSMRATSYPGQEWVPHMWTDD